MMDLSDRATRDRLLLSIDIIMFIIAVISMVFVILTAYHAGYLYGIGDYPGAQSSLMKTGGSIAFLSVSMMWIFIRFFKGWSKRI